MEIITTDPGLTGFGFWVVASLAVFGTIVLAWFVGNYVYRKIAKRKIHYTAGESFHVLKLHKEKRDPFWFRVHPERGVKEPGNNYIKLERRAIFLLILIKNDGSYGYELVEGDVRTPLTTAWRQELDAAGYPLKGYIEPRELDRLYAYQVHRRNQARPRGRRNQAFP